MFTGSMVAIVTPMNIDGSVDWPALEKLVEHHIAQGTDAIVSVGTTGESATLDHNEHTEVIERTVKAVAGRIPVIGGTGANSTSEAVLLTERAAAAGVDGCLLVVPYYNKPPQDGLAAHFRAIAEAAPELPLMLYNIPGRTGCSMAPETVAQLMDCPNVVSFKAASGTTEEVTALRLACGSKLAIYSGDDGLTLPMMSVGAVGVVSVASHVVGPQIRAMIEAYLRGDAAVALALHEQLQPVFKALFATTNPIPVKAALQLNGWSVGDPRPPLSPLPDDMRSTLAQTMAALRQT